MEKELQEIENRLHKYEYGLDNGLITLQEYDELTTSVLYDLKLLANRI